MLKIRTYLGSFIGKLTYIAMAITLFLVFMTTLDVVLRKVSNYSFLGSYELTEMGMIIILWIAIAYYQVSKGHIRVTMLIDMMPKRLQIFMDIFANLLGAVLLALCVYAGILRTMANISKDLRTSVLLLPQYPFSTFMVIGQLLFFLLLLIDAIMAVTDFVKYRKPVEEVGPFTKVTA